MSYSTQSNNIGRYVDVHEMIVAQEERSLNI